MKIGRKERALLTGGIVTCAHWSLSVIYLAIILMHYREVVPFGAFLTSVRVVGSVLEFPSVKVLWFLSKWSEALVALYIPVVFLNGGLWGMTATVIDLWVSKPKAPASLSASE